MTITIEFHSSVNFRIMKAFCHIILMPCIEDDSVLQEILD